MTVYCESESPRILSLSFVDPFPELSRPRQESTDSNTKNQANAKKWRVPTILDEDSDDDFVDSENNTLCCYKLNKFIQGSGIQSLAVPHLHR